MGTHRPYQSQATTAIAMHSSPCVFYSLANVTFTPARRAQISLSWPVGFHICTRTGFDSSHSLLITLRLGKFDVILESNFRLLSRQLKACRALKQTSACPALMKSIEHSRRDRQQGSCPSCPVVGSSLLVTIIMIVISTFTRMYTDQMSTLHTAFSRALSKYVLTLSLCILT